MVIHLGARLVSIRKRRSGDDMALSAENGKWRQFNLLLVRLRDESWIALVLVRPEEGLGTNAICFSGWPSIGLEMRGKT